MSFFFLVLIWSCSEKKDNFELNGVLCYPSEYIPKMTVYLKDVDSGQLRILKTNDNQSHFKFSNLPAGEYCAYAYTIDEEQADADGKPQKGHGGYTHAVPCGLKVGCDDHALIRISVGESTDTVQICDWYGAEVPEEALTD